MRQISSPHVCVEELSLVPREHIADSRQTSETVCACPQTCLFVEAFL